MAIRSRHLSAFLTRCPTEHDALRVHFADNEQLAPWWHRRGVIASNSSSPIVVPVVDHLFQNIGIRPFRHFAKNRHRRFRSGRQVRAQAGSGEPARLHPFIKAAAPSCAARASSSSSPPRSRRSFMNFFSESSSSLSLLSPSPNCAAGQGCIVQRESHALERRGTGPIGVNV